MSFDHTEPLDPSTYSIYKRLANLGLAFAALVVALNIWFFSAGQDTQDLAEQTDQLGRSLIQQGAGLAAMAMTSENEEALSIQQLLDQLATDPHVQSVSLHDARGRMLNTAGTDTPITDLFTQQQTAHSLVYVQEILHQQELQGYLRLVLDRQRVLQHQNSLVQHYSQQTQILMLLAFAIGILLTRAFYKLRYARLRQPE
ncbi:AhpA/YtjB family protein [Lacimicrobium sp. SS2-24]|uniref:AhpA/YtjB family protein n=1 Tax=Lacimicrobium sp. SS2-24 TaxID=2005569 RepID=UPI001439608D|nr:AhpA/YtjB family protein [Lacimicrobium sp. SS2-24]